MKSVTYFSKSWNEHVTEFLSTAYVVNLKKNQEHKCNLISVYWKHSISILQKEREEVIRKDREEEEKALRQTLNMYDEDKKAFFQYADEIIDESKKKGRNLYPILCAIQVSYKTEYYERKYSIDKWCDSKETTNLEPNIWKELCTEFKYFLPQSFQFCPF